MTRRAAAAAAIAAALILGPVHLDAHRLDEYLQATRLSIAHSRVDLEIDLTPGTAIAERIARDIDLDGDGRFSPTEADAYARGVLATLTLSADSESRPMTLEGQVFPDRAAMLEGVGTIRLRAAATLPSRSAGRHTIEYSNGYQPEASVYLANTLVPDDRRITIDAQDRDPLQRRLTVTYDVASSGTQRAGAIAATVTVFVIIAGRRRRAAGRAA
jgi:hypothetical protein